MIPKLKAENHTGGLNSTYRIIGKPHGNELPLSKLFYPQVACLTVGNGFMLLSPSSFNSDSLIINGEHNQDSGLVSWMLSVAMKHKQK